MQFTIFYNRLPALKVVYKFAIPFLKKVFKLKQHSNHT